MAVVQRTSPVERSLISRCNSGPAPRQQQVRRREIQCLSEPNRAELTKRSQLLTREQQPNDTWGALSRYSYDDRAEDNEQVAESTTFPPRYKVVLACMLAFVVCNMDKVNMSVAILPMAQEFGWSPSVAGLVQSSFFWGYMLSQIPAGYLANKFSGRWVLPGGVGVWSGFTAAVPLLTSTLPTLCVSRAAVGFGEGVAPSAVNDIVAKTIPQNERGRAISTIFGGLHIGSILGLILAPPLIKALGWPSVFYAFGALGLVWILGFEKLLSDPSKEVQDMRRSLLSGTSAAEASSNDSSASAASESSDAQKQALSGVPYRAFLRNGPTRALMFTHFCNNWFHYTMLAWLPTYFTQTLHLNIAEASTVSLFPSIAGVLVSSIAGQVADKLIENKVPVRTVRLLAQCTAFLVPATCLVAACSFQGTYASIICIAAALGLNSFALAGLYCTHQDMSQQFAGPLLGLTNTSGAVPGILGVAIVGLLLDLTDSWQIALFTPIIFFFLAGTAVYSMYASSEAQDYSDNTPFEFEGKILSPFSGGSQQK